MSYHVPAPEDITESMGVVPYPLPLRTQGGPAEEKPLLSLLEPMPTLETKTDDGNMVKGQGADVSASSKFRPVAGRSPFSPIQRLAQKDVPMALVR